MVKFLRDLVLRFELPSIQESALRAFKAHCDACVKDQREEVEGLIEASIDSLEIRQGKLIEQRINSRLPRFVKNAQATAEFVWAYAALTSYGHYLEATGDEQPDFSDRLSVILARYEMEIAMYGGLDYAPA